MGLGNLDLTLTVEKEFGIKIPDGDAERLMTVGSVIDYVVEKTGWLSREPVADRIRSFAMGVFGQANSHTISRTDHRRDEFLQRPRLLIYHSPSVSSESLR